MKGISDTKNNNSRVRIANVFCDLDDTLAEAYFPLSHAVRREVVRALEAGINVFILTDETEVNLVNRVLKRIPDNLKQFLHIFSEGGSVGFGHCADGRRIGYFEKSFSQDERQVIFSALDYILGKGNYEIEIDDSPNRMGIQLNPDTPELCNGDQTRIAEEIERRLKSHGVTSTLAYIGNGVFRIYPFAKHDAIGWVIDGTELNKTREANGLPSLYVTEDLSMIIADQTGKYRNDWRLFHNFKSSLRIHVGYADQELMISDSDVLAVGSFDKETEIIASPHIHATERVLAYLNEHDGWVDEKELRGILQAPPLSKEKILRTHSNTVQLLGQMNFFGNYSLFWRYIEDIHVRNGRGYEEIIRDMMGINPRQRFPILPEEMWLYLLPIAKEIKNNKGKAVFFGRGTIPFSYLWAALSEALSMLGIQVSPDYEVLKTGSFEDSPLLNPNRKCVGSERLRCEGISAVSVTINSLLTEEELGRAISDGEWQKLMKEYEGMPSRAEFDEELERSRGYRRLDDIKDKNQSTTKGQLISIIADIGIDKRYINLLQRFYAIPFYSIPAQYYLEGRPLTGSLFIGEIERHQERVPQAPKINDEEKEAITKRLDHISDNDGRIILDSWEKAWLVIQSTIDAYHRANRTGEIIRSSECYSECLLRILLSDTEFYKRNAGNSLIGLDDSSLSGRTPLLLKLIGRIVSPEREHKIGVVSLCDCYGQSEPVDFVVSRNAVLFPEEEPETYDRYYSFISGGQDEMLVSRYLAIPYSSFRRNVPKNEGLQAKSRFDRIAGKISKELEDRFEKLFPGGTFRNDTDMSPAGEILIYYLRGENEPVSSMAVEEYLPNTRHDEYTFMNLGRRVFQYKRRALQEYISLLKEMENRKPSLLKELRTAELQYRPFHINKVIDEFEAHLEEYKERQTRGLCTFRIHTVQKLVNEYFENKIGFEEARAVATSFIRTDVPAISIIRTLS